MSMISWIIAGGLGVAILLIGAFYIYVKYGVYNYWKKLNIFYLEPSFPSGNAYDLITSKLAYCDYFADLYNRYKNQPMIGLYMLISPILIVNDPVLIRDILTKEFSSFHDRGMFCNEKLDPLTGNLFLLPGKKWRNFRVQLMPTFTSGKIKHMFQTLKVCGESMSTYLESKAQARELIEMKDILARFSTDIIMSVAFGISCNSLEDPENEFRYWGKKSLEPRPLWNTLLVFAPQVFNFFRMTYTKKGLRNFINNLFKENVEDRVTRKIHRRDFMELLIQLMNKGYIEADEKKDEMNDTKLFDCNKLTMAEATAQAYAFFLAGFETSSTASTFCFYELAKNQDIQNKVREEIQTVFKKHGGMTYDSLNEMTYLHKVLSETLRKYPPLIALNRKCTKDVQLKGMTSPLPKGTLVMIPVFSIQRNPDFYPDPEKFDPERFTKEEIAARDPYIYLPFGEGPRYCIGMRFGLIQTKVAIVSGLSKFKYKLAPTIKTPIVYERGNLILTPEEGMPLIIEPA